MALTAHKRSVLLAAEHPTAFGAYTAASGDFSALQQKVVAQVELLCGTTGGTTVPEERAERLRTIFEEELLKRVRVRFGCIEDESPEQWRKAPVVKQQQVEGPTAAQRLQQAHPS
jgi:hypothetical protein